VAWRRLKQRRRHARDAVLPDEDLVREIVDAFNHFFFHYAATPLLVVETSGLDLAWDDDTLDELLKQVHTMTGGTRYYVPRTA